MQKIPLIQQLASLFQAVFDRPNSNKKRFSGLESEKSTGAEFQKLHKGQGSGSMDLHHHVLFIILKLQILNSGRH